MKNDIKKFIESDWSELLRLEMAKNTFLMRFYNEHVKIEGMPEFSDLSYDKMIVLSQMNSYGMFLLIGIIDEYCNLLKELLIKWTKILNKIREKTLKNNTSVHG